VEDSFSTGEETRHGALIGTPEYMAPEQCMGREVDQRTDVYSCGVLLYRMVTGQVPFDGTNAHPFELCQRHIGEDPVAPREIVPWISPAMEQVILKALGKAPDERQQSAVQLRDELLRVLALIEEADMEPTARQEVAQLVSPKDAAALAAELAATLPVPFDLADTAAVDSDRAPMLRPIQAVINLPPVKLIGPPEGAEAPATRRRLRRNQRKLSSYLPTMALAAVIGAGLGSLFMALAPLMAH
jgi:serine/threonine protein kinase